MNFAIRIDNLDYTFDNRQVLKALSFDVPQGIVFMIIGPNGSGKTTLMNLIAGILKLQKGQINIQDHRIQHYPRKAMARMVAFVPQTLGADLPFTVFETVMMGRAPHLNVLGIAGHRDAAIAEEAMAFTMVDHLGDRKLDQLSGGEQKRVFIARAICQQPEIILLDEPTASLDLAHQVQMLDLMEKLKKQKGMTVVMVSHDVNLAAMYCDRLLLLNDGHVAGLGKPHEVLTYQRLEETYGCKLLVDESPIGGFPRVTLVPGRFMDADETQ
jgi:iron complex transport system ATP-binding protein